MEKELYKKPSQVQFVNWNYKKDYNKTYLEVLMFFN